MFDKKTIEEFKKPLKAHTLPTAARGYKYAKISEVIDKLNTAFDYSWSSEVLSIDHKDRFVLCHVVLSVLDSNGTEVKKHGLGGVEIKVLSSGQNKGKFMDLAKDYASAFASALKQAAKQFGIRVGEDEKLDKPPFSKNTTNLNTRVNNAPRSQRTPMAPSPPPMPSRITNRKMNGADLVNQTMKNLPRNSGTTSVQSTAPNTTSNMVKSSGEVSEFQQNALRAISRRLNMTPVELIEGALGQSEKTAFDELTKDEAVKVVGYGNTLVWENEATEQ